MKIPNREDHVAPPSLSLARIVSEDSQHREAFELDHAKSSKDS